MAANPLDKTLRTLFRYYRDIEPDSRLLALAQETAQRYGLPDDEPWNRIPEAKTSSNNKEIIKK
ncbi:MAG: hypothetical protein LBM77_05330 [Spirochaetaceae bacterium]|jgi:hypothetical protein|nr:hypothetical protein [Spirochaetaceae bacterium]